jgi:hypothetical protein
LEDNTRSKYEMQGVIMWTGFMRLRKWAACEYDSEHSSSIKVKFLSSQATINVSLRTLFCINTWSVWTSAYLKFRASTGALSLWHTKRTKSSRVWLKKMLQKQSPSLTQSRIVPCDKAQNVCAKQLDLPSQRLSGSDSIKLE